MTDLVWFHDMEFDMMQLFEFKIAQLAKMLQSKTPQELRCSSCGEMEEDVDGREESKDTKPGNLPESAQKTGIGKTGLPEGKYTRNTRGDNQE